MSVKKLDYNFGDCEIRELLFDHPHALIIVYDPHSGQDVHIKAFDVRNLLFLSDHLQNVVSAIYEFEPTDLPQQAQQFSFLMASQTLFAESMRRFPESKILHAHGIAGGDLLCQADRIELGAIPTTMPTD